MILIAGLGNPEKKYAGTRHNVGFEAAEILRQQMGWGRTKTKFHSELVQGTLGAEPCLLCRPLTYMNNSGIAVREIADFYRIPPDGHNGIRSIIAHLGTQDFARVRIGVGAKPEGMDLADYVLGRFSAEELPLIRQACTQAAEAVQVWVRQGLDKAMNQYNRKGVGVSGETARP